jgi:hypothetical protein
MRRKKILHEPFAPGGGRQRAKIKNRKIENRKSEFSTLAEKEEKAKNPWDRTSLFDGYRRRQKGTSACWNFNTALDRIYIALRYRSFRQLKVSRST